MSGNGRGAARHAEAPAVQDVLALPSWREQCHALGRETVRHRLRTKAVFSWLDLEEDTPFLPLSAQVGVDPDLNARLVLHRGDITALKCDAIVNAARPSLLGGGGVDGAIHRRAGPGLLEACRLLDGCAHGDAKTTGGFKLPARHVIHCVGPHRDLHTDDEWAPLLRQTYRAGLEEAVRHGCRTIAFSAISAGAYRVPERTAVNASLQTIRAWLEEGEGEHRAALDRVVVVCFTESLMHHNVELCQRYFPAAPLLPGPRPLCLSLASTMIDDLVLVDGSRHEGLIGGAGPYAAWGMAPWLEDGETMLVTRVGKDCPPELLEQVRAQGISTKGVRQIEHKQPRGLSVFHEDRPRDFSLEDVDGYRQHFRATVEDIPGDCFRITACGVHLLSSPKRCLALLGALHDAGHACLSLYEPGPVYCLPEHLEDFRAAAGAVSVFSPNHEESEQLLGVTGFDEMVDRYLAMGARVVALRCGAEGSLVATQYDRWRIPVVPGDVVDVTGCGNSYCGGFLAALTGVVTNRHPIRHKGGVHPILHAAVCGAVSASFTLAQVGVSPRPDKAEVEERYTCLLARCRRTVR